MFYNIFGVSNMINIPTNLSKVSQLLGIISPKQRLEIILVIGEGEACVCHLEARLGYRQAYISQQLMALREAGLVDSSRNGKYIFYRLAKPDILELLQNAAKIAGLDKVKLERARHEKQCTCPHCAPEISNSVLIENAN
jgi:DNA-binding transcriptional ArsR family regulator